MEYEKLMEELMIFRQRKSPFSKKEFFPEKSFRLLQGMLHSNKEIEASLGRFEKDKKTERIFFVPGLYIESFMSLYKRLIFLLKNNEGTLELEISEKKEYRKGDIRKAIDLTNPTIVIYDQKIRDSRKIDVYEYGYRISQSTEQFLDPKKFQNIDFEKEATISRTKTRYSFIESDEEKPWYGTSIDLTFVVSEDLQKNNITHSYEVEIERKGSITPEHFVKTIKDILMLSQDTKDEQLLISKNERNMVINDFNLLFSKTEKVLFSNSLYDRFINKPVNIKIHDLMSESKYAVTNKLDGLRKFLYINKNGIYLLNPPHTISKIGKGLLEFENTLIDGEYITDNVCSYHAFDILFLKGEELRTRLFDERIKKIPELKLPIALLIKKYFKSDNLYENTNKCWKIVLKLEEKGYKNDGMIFQPINESYKTKNLKWKPPETLTIDFLVLDGTLLVKGKKDYEEFKGTEQIPFDKKIKITRFENININGKILEFKWNFEKKNFKPIRFRFDKTNPQYVEWAKDIWTDIHRPITLQTILGNTTTIMRKYHNKVKMEMLLKNFKRNDTIIDVGSGRGGDVDKWIKQGLNVFPIEPNKENLKEFIKRSNGDFEPLNMGAEEYEKIYEKTGKVDGIVSFFSLTFMTENKTKFNSFMKTIYKTLNPGGKFIGIVFDGQKVKEFLDENSGEYKSETFSVSEIKINSNKTFGNSIKVCINDEKSMVKDQKEYLVDFEMLKEELQKHDFILLQYFFLDNVNFLPSDSYLFSRLNRAFVFEKKIKEKKKHLTLLEMDQIKPFKIGSLNLVRIGTIGDGSCFFHSVARACSNKYLKLGKKKRKEYVVDIRKKLSEITLTEFLKLNNGNFAKLLKEQYMEKVPQSSDKNIFKFVKCIFCKELKEPDIWVGTSSLISTAIIEYIGNELDLDIYVILDNKIINPEFVMKSKNRKFIILLNIDNVHFETIGIKRNDKIETIFEPDDPLKTNLNI